VPSINTFGKTSDTMRHRFLGALALVSLLLALPAAGAARGGDLTCTVVARRWLRYPGATYFTLTATADSLRAGTWKARRWDLPSSRPAPDTATPVVVHGQVVRLDTCVGRWPGALRRTSGGPC
jgi:hypothetical protein